MDFHIDSELLLKSRAYLWGRDDLYWIMGGSGSGKSTLCQALSHRLDIPVYDMDAHIYGAYHERFTKEAYPVNHTWSAAPDGFAWLLNMSWVEFDNFHRAALPEYLDLLCADLQASVSAGPLLIDGGLWHPALLVQAIPSRQIVTLLRPDLTSRQIWEETDERLAMKEMVQMLPDADRVWRTFLKFDGHITQTIAEESRQHHIPICVRHELETVEETSGRVKGRSRFRGMNS